MANEDSLLTNSETGVVRSPVAGRGRGTTGGGGTSPDSARLMGERLGSSRYRQASRVIMEKPGCGDTSHGFDCLCDVVVANGPTPIRVSFPHDITFAQVICEHMGYEAPYSLDDVLDCLQMAARAKDMLDSNRMDVRWRDNQKVPHDAREFMRECAEQGMRNKEVRKQVLEKWNVEISPAYISKRRYLYTGEKGTKE
jgi:hypothetical protein